MIGCTDEATQYAELCESMAEILEKYGHARGVLGSSRVGYCLMGAARRALGVYSSKSVSEAEISAVNRRIVCALGFYDTSGIVALNDGWGCEPPLNKESAIEFVTQRAKYWRNK